MTVRAAFLGNAKWSTPALQALAAADGVHVAVVVTNPPRPAGRGSATTGTAVAQAARNLGIPLEETVGVSGGPGLAALRAADPDVLAVVAYGELLSREVLDIAPLGAVNLHFSLLPRWRGASPVQRALLAGDEVTGVTAMLMDEHLDTGPILGAVEVPILPEDDAGSLGARLASLGARLMVEAIGSLAAGVAMPQPQDGALATVAPRLTPEERWIDWSESADSVLRRVRALGPEPGASTRLRGEILKVFRAEVVVEATIAEGLVADRSGREEPGVVVAVDRDGIVIATGEGAIRPLEVAVAGRKRMAAGDWARGARLAPGARLG